jgi:hypothetical protein
MEWLRIPACPKGIMLRILHWNDTVKVAISAAAFPMPPTGSDQSREKPVIPV